MIVNKNKVKKYFIYNLLIFLKKKELEDWEIDLELGLVSDPNVIENSKTTIEDEEDKSDFETDNTKIYEQNGNEIISEEKPIVLPPASVKPGIGFSTEPCQFIPSQIRTKVQVEFDTL